MTSVLFICKANINRSVMAEVIFRQLVQVAGLEEQISIDSAATDTMHVGKRPFFGTRGFLQLKQLHYDGIVSRQVTDEDRQKDYVLVMDSENVNKLISMGWNPPPAKLLTYAPEFGTEDVPDPSVTWNWPESFERIERACINLLQHIRQQEGL